jgi:hypothetical protein
MTGEVVIQLPGYCLYAVISSESGPYSAIDPYVKPFSPPELPEITALTGTPVLIDNEEIQTQ